MSRFFNNDYSSDDESSDFDDDNNISSKMVNKHDSSNQYQDNAYAYFSDSDSEGGRVIRSEKEKRYEALQTAIKTMKSQIKK